MRYVAIPLLLLITGCVTEVVPPRAEVVVRPPEVYVPAPPRPVVSVYVEPPLSQPAPIAIGWAPPPMLVENPPPPPFAEAVWVGGYWVWEGNWVWAHGHWVSPPRPEYAWVHPYYEHRDGVVIFITGHWAAPGVVFVPPPPGIHLTVEVAAAGVVAGPPPMGPNGCFVPAPPGSRLGIIIPAPVGTAPAVVTSAPPVVAVGMRVTNNVNNTNVTNINNSVHNNTVINNTTNNITNVKNVTNITNVTIVAPPNATASGQAVNASVPAQAHLAAALPPVVKAQAPEPASQKAIPAFVHGRAPASLPPAQAVSVSQPASAQAHAPQNPPPHAAVQQPPHPPAQAHAPNSPPPAVQAEAEKRPTAQTAADRRTDRPTPPGRPQTNEKPADRPEVAAVSKVKADQAPGAEHLKPGNASKSDRPQPVAQDAHPNPKPANANNGALKGKPAPAAAKSKDDHGKKPPAKGEKDHEKEG